MSAASVKPSSSRRLGVWAASIRAINGAASSWARSAVTARAAARSGRKHLPARFFRIKTPRINFDDNASQPGSRNDSYCLWFAFYNFCRIHSTIRVTPAMEAGIADHVWDLKEILALTRYLKK
jgi:hypothetical protein